VSRLVRRLGGGGVRRAAFGIGLQLLCGLGGVECVLKANGRFAIDAWASVELAT
jgi:hypothetical protein